MMDPYNLHCLHDFGNVGTGATRNAERGTI